MKEGTDESNEASQRHLEVSRKGKKAREDTLGGGRRHFWERR